MASQWSVTSALVPPELVIKAAQELNRQRNQLMAYQSIRGKELLDQGRGSSLLLSNGGKVRQRLSESNQGGRWMV